MSGINVTDLKRARERARKSLSYDHPISAKRLLEELADYATDDLLPDDYGKGELHQRLSRRVAELLGKPSAVFLPTGRMAQQIVLKLWCERSGANNVAMHPRCHLQEYENTAYEHVFGLRSIHTGGYNRLTSLSDLEAIREPVGVVHLEVPQLSLACRVPSWPELQSISKWARDRAVPIHLDGARLWECGPFYERSYSEIASLFDTIYVSFYKGLGAMSGAAVAGAADFIESVRLWQDRLGGNPPKWFPILLDAERMLDRSLPLMGSFYQKACRLAEAFSSIPGIWVTPHPPHTNTFVVTIEGDAARLVEAAATAAAETGLWLVDFTRDTAIDGLAQFQVVVGTATLDVKEDEAVTTLRRLVQLMR